MVDHDILRLDIAMHDTDGVAVMQAFQYLVEVKLALFWFDDL